MTRKGFFGTIAAALVAPKVAPALPLTLYGHPVIITGARRISKSYIITNGCITADKISNVPLALTLKDCQFNRKKRYG